MDLRALRGKNKMKKASINHPDPLQIKERQGEKVILCSGGLEKNMTLEENIYPCTGAVRQGGHRHPPHRRGGQRHPHLWLHGCTVPRRLQVHHGVKFLKVDYIFFFYFVPDF